MITCLTSISVIFSIISSFIYFFIITALSQSLHVFIEFINLTVTFYFIVAEIAFSIIDNMIDHTDRRLISLLIFILYLATNLELAAQNSYVTFQILRCLQSADASNMMTIAYDVIADIAFSAERDSYVELLLSIANAASSLKSVLDDLIAERLF